MHRVWIQSIFGGMESTITLGASKRDLSVLVQHPLYLYTTPPKKLVFWVSSKISLVKWISVPQCSQWLTFWRTNSAEGVLFHLLMYVDVWTCNSILKEIEGKNGRGRRCWKVLLLSSVQIKFSLMSRTCRQLPTVLSLKNESDMPRFFQAT